MQAIVEGRVQSIGSKIRLISEELSTVSKNLEDRIGSFEGTLHAVRNYFDSVYEKANQYQQIAQQAGYQNEEENRQGERETEIILSNSSIANSNFNTNNNSTGSRSHQQSLPVMRDAFQKLHDHLAQP